VREETKVHLEQVESAIHAAKVVLSRFGYPDDQRTTMVVGFISQIVEHHRAMLLLCRADLFGSAFALARSIFESMYRGMWINFCATQEQIVSFDRDDKFPVNMTQMAREIDQAYRAGDFFEDFKNRSWNALCSYTHTGLLQLGRRFTEHTTEPSYTDEEVVEISTSSTTSILLLAGKFLAVQGHDKDCIEVEQLTETYGPALERVKTESASKPTEGEDANEEPRP
jgi:hypothetical protein